MGSLNFKLKTILNADHVFVTGTAAEIQTVRKIKNKNYKTNSKIINLIKDSYNEIKTKSPVSTSLTSVPIGTLSIQDSPPLPFWSLPRPGSPFFAFQCFLK